jgi:F0F1-type ATP synthase membrane subunit b/b'
MLLIVIQVIIFGGLIYILRHIFTRNVIDATKHLEDLGQDFNQKQETLNKKLEEAERTYQEKIAAAHDEASKIKMQTIKEAQEEKERIIQQARLQGQEAVQQADKTSQSILTEVDERIEKEAIAKASELLRLALPSALKQDIHNRLVSELIEAGFAQLDKMQLSDEAKQVKVSSAFSLNEEQRRAIHDKLKKKLNREISLKEELDEKLVAGVLVCVGSLVLDGSLKYKIQEEARIKLSHLKDTNL